jgi:hypothetical protein
MYNKGVNIHMNQEKNKKLLLQLHHAITGTKKSCKQIIKERKIDPDINLIYQTGYRSSCDKVSVKDYYTLT